MDLPEELSTPILEAAFENQLDDQSDSTTTFELETPQNLSDVNQQVDPTTSEQPVPDEEDSDFTGPLRENQRREIESKFLGDIYITFDTQDEKIRAQNSLLPRRFYRTFYETSATLSSYVTVDTHVKHRQRKNLKINDGNAFQAVAKFSIHQGMLRETIERHLVWNSKRIPSPYISAFNALRHAKRRAVFHYEKSQRIGQRVSIAGIRTNHLVPATIRGLCESTIKIFTKGCLLENNMKIKRYTQHVEIPVWIHKKAKENYGSKITPEEWKASGADMWISITEVRLSNLERARPKIRTSRDIICAKGHSYEWLCCGAIHKSKIAGVWPWDGKRIHLTDPGYPIRSFKNSGQPWVWNWDKKMWLPDSFSASATATQTKDPGTKRQCIDNIASQDKDKKIANCERCKNPPPLSMSIIKSIEVEPVCLAPAGKS